jgi:Phosphotransferase enzyme family
MSAQAPPARSAVGGALRVPAPLLHADVADYALAEGLVDPARVVAGDLIVRNLSSRNRVYALESHDGPSWLIKQGVEQMGAAMIRNEARAYGTLHSLDSSVRQRLAPWHGYDQQRGVLTIGLVRNAISLRELHRRSVAPPVAVAGELGRMLGMVHSRTMLASADPESTWLPPALLLHQPGIDLLHEGSGAAIELVKILQQTPGFAARLDELRGQWRTRAFVHLDVKWDNCLVSGKGHDRLALIDWESAGLGDPCWDIGSALAHYLSFWIFSIPIGGETPVERFAELAERPLASMQPAMRACWEGYTDALGTTPACSVGWLIHTVRLAAARLVLTAFEAAQASTALTGALMLHLQLALNMLERPHESAVHLLGLSLRETRA